MKKLYYVDVDLKGKFLNGETYYTSTYWILWADNTEEAEKKATKSEEKYHVVDRACAVEIDLAEVEWDETVELRKGNNVALRRCGHYNPGNNGWDFVPCDDWEELHKNGYSTRW